MKKTFCAWVRTGMLGLALLACAACGGDNDEMPASGTETETDGGSGSDSGEKPDEGNPDEENNPDEEIPEGEVTSTISSAAELEALGPLEAGRTIIWKDGTYDAQKIHLTGTGSEAEPILFRAENPGGVRFTGASTLSIDGSYLHVSGFQWIDPVPDGEHLIRFESGSQACRLEDCAIDGSGSESDADSRLGAGSELRAGSRLGADSAAGADSGSEADSVPAETEGSVSVAGPSSRPGSDPDSGPDSGSETGSGPEERLRSLNSNGISTLSSSSVGRLFNDTDARPKASGYMSRASSGTKKKLFSFVARRRPRPGSTIVFLSLRTPAISDRNCSRYSRDTSSGISLTRA